MGFHSREGILKANFRFAMLGKSVIIGWVEKFEGSLISGWAFDKERTSERLFVEVLHKNEVIASGVADILRSDLPAAGIGDGHHAFQIALPEHIRTFEDIQILAHARDQPGTLLKVALKDQSAVYGALEAITQRLERSNTEITRRLDKLEVQCKTLLSHHEEHDNIDGVLTGISEFKDVVGRLDALELFVVRLDEIAKQMNIDLKSVRRKRFLGIF